MSERLDDEQLLTMLGGALEVAEPVPAHMLEAAYEIMSPDAFEEELARLVFDSASGDLVGVRSSETARQVTFRAPGVEIEVMVVAEGERRLIGQLVPPQAATVELRSGEQVRETGTDRLGRFQFANVSPGSVQLAVTTEHGGRVVTEWMVL